MISHSLVWPFGPTLTWMDSYENVVRRRQNAVDELVVGIAAAFWQILCDMSPYLLFGFLMAGLLSVAISPETVERHLGGRGVGPVLKASLFGVPLPLCSCGVVPVAASLRRHGASRGATAAFALSTPQTGVDSIMVTLSLLGPVFAVFRPVAAFVTGLLGGQLVAALPEGDDDAQIGEQPCGDACCSDDDGGTWLGRSLRYGFVTLPRDIGHAMLVGLLISGILSALVPDDYFAGLLGVGVLPMLAMVCAGIPLYVCATASVPIAAALISKGVSPGAALVFLMTGPATNAATISTLWRILGKRATIVYVLSLLMSSLVCGLLLDHVVTTIAPGSVQPMHWMLPPAIQAISAVALLVVLGVALWPRSRAGSASEAGGPSETLVLRVEGMTCSHCAESVRRALLECAQVASAEVGADADEARITGHALNESDLRQAIEALGFNTGQCQR